MIKKLIIYLFVFICLLRLCSCSTSTTTYEESEKIGMNYNNISNYNGFWLTSDSICYLDGSIIPKYYLIDKNAKTKICMSSGYGSGKIQRYDNKIYILDEVDFVNECNPLLRKLNRYDHYWTVFDNLGNQPVDTTAIFFTDSEKAGGIDLDYVNDVFGYQEAWTEYRMKQNRVSGLMRPDHPMSLFTWNYSTLFTEPPVLNGEFVEEDPNLIDRTIAVTDEPQFIIDSYFDYIDVKNMSVHSIPGLLRL